ncbi:MAG TPA: HAMP domain-containing sensor histidine kinase [Arenibaculum sp.]|nr:HAMP domain-containing sensor histidine kinase [Arenibaculum sp.]
MTDRTAGEGWGQDVTVTAEAVRLLYRNGGFSIAANLATGLLLASFLWPNPSPAVLAGWLLTMAGVMLCRAILVHRFRRVDPPATRMAVWARRYTAGALAAGLTWGIGGALFHAPGDLTRETIIVLSILGMAMGAVPVHAAHLPTVYAYVPATILPLLGAFALTGTVLHVVMALMGLVYLGMLLVAARSQNRTLDASLRLRHERDGLIEELRRAKHEAEVSSRAKSEFLATVSHEIRTPLTAINGFSEILEREMFGPLGNPRYLSYAADIRASGAHLLDLINDILDLSKAEAGALKLEEQDFDLTQAVQSSVRLLSERAINAGLRLSMRRAADRMPMHGDARAMKQVVINLLSNAVKFTPAGGRIEVSVSYGEDGSGLIAVADSGIGMPPEDIPLAMTPFGQLENPLTRSHKGTGLGLPLARTLVELHGVSLDVASIPEKGTTVTVRIPADRIRPPVPSGG